MVPQTPPQFFAVVYRGGAVQFCKADQALQLMDARLKNAVVTIPMQGSPELIDTASIERILPFEAWRESETPRLAMQRKRVCPFGTIHDDDENCDCHMNNKIPLLESTARSIVRAIEEYASLPSADRALRDDSRGPWIPDLISNGYAKRVAETYGLPLTLPTPTHG